MIDADTDFDAYLRRIEFDGRATPTLETLGRLVERHSASIPF